MEVTIKSIKMSKGSTRNSHRVEAILIETSRGATREITVEYPVQGKRHLAGVMKSVMPGQNLNHLFIQNAMVKIKELMEWSII